MAKTYCCPYCREKFNKDKLINHIDKEHDDELPENYTAYRAAYDVINDKPGHGFCVVCHAPTKWNEKRQKYERLCGKKECSDQIKKTYRGRMLKVYGKVHLLDDPNQQKKMLSHRHISGKYKWSDGTIFDYVGSYEKELLEFLDKTLEYKSSDIVSPGPTLEYEYKGKKHYWITDFLILSYNLILEVKDGGSNPNKRFMPEYRAKQYAKEKMITNMGVYSYLRLTNKDFSQLLGILAELKKDIVEDKVHPLYRIHEDIDLVELDPDFTDPFPDIQAVVEALNNDRTLDPISNLIEYNCDTKVINHPSDGYLLYEVITIKPALISQSLKETFTKYIDIFTGNLRSILQENVQIYMKDENDINKGIGIGLTFE